MPAMQIGIEQLIPMMMGNMQQLSIESSQQRDNFNIMFRILYNKGIINDNDVKEAVKSWYEDMKELNQIESMPDDETLESLADDILMWIKGDLNIIKERMNEFETKMKELKDKHDKKIDVVSGDVLNALNRSDPKKLIL